MDSIAWSDIESSLRPNG